MGLCELGVGSVNTSGERRHGLRFRLGFERDLKKKRGNWIKVDTRACRRIEEVSLFIGGIKADTRSKIDEPHDYAPLLDTSTELSPFVCRKNNSVIAVAMSSLAYVRVSWWFSRTEQSASTSSIPSRRS